MQFNLWRQYCETSPVALCESQLSFVITSCGHLSVGEVMPCQQCMLQGMPSSVDVIADSDSDVAEVVDIVDSNFGAERFSKM